MVSSKWQSYLKSFQYYLKIERGLSQNTIDNYTLDIEKLVSFLNDNQLQDSPITISEETLQQFIYTLSRQINARSQARIISGLKSFFHYLIFDSHGLTLFDI